MIGDLEMESFYVELRMMRTGGDDRAFLVVEGPTDCAALDEYIDSDHCISIPALGKDRAISAISTIIENSDRGMFAILDKDWIELLESEPRLSDNFVAYTDHYDLDACLFYSDRMIVRQAASFCSDKFRLGESACSEEDLMRSCIQLALPVGALRYLSERDGTGLALRDFPMGATITGPYPYEIDRTKLVAIAAAKAGKSGNLEPLTRELESTISSLVNHKRYCSGHDLFKAFALLLKRRWGGRVSAQQLEQSARAAMSHERITSFLFYERVQLISKRAGYRVWKPH
ncbi:hypothetical protein [Streptomyces lydicus]|uniref:hypothetical protein n=1 Tax=Streptomyces lydicus TaxID=47763 RepID=UPI00378DE08D